LINNDDGRTTLIQSEKIKDVLISLKKRKLKKDAKTGFEKINQALKEKVEQKKGRRILDEFIKIKSRHFLNTCFLFSILKTY